jgi:hypothetical protein
LPSETGCGRFRVSRDRLYTLLALPRIREGVVSLDFTPGVAAYAFTFGADVPAGAARSSVNRGRSSGPVIARDRFYAPS